MTFRGWKAGVAAAVIVAVGLPVGASILYARHDARARMLDQARLYAAEVLHRSEATADQIQAGINQLRAVPGAPCSAAHVATMRRIDLGSSYIQAIGHVEGNQLVCSSLAEQRQLELGPPLLTSPGGAVLRTDVSLSPANSVGFIIVELHGYAAVVHKQLPLDVDNDRTGVCLGTYAYPTGKILTSRGAIDPGWVRGINRGKTATFVADSRPVAVRASKRWFIGSVAALPGSALRQATAVSMRQFVPAGALVGVVLAALVLLLARRRQSLQAGLRGALRRHELFLEYQPIVELATRRVVGAEALLRWRRSDGVVVRPDLFIPVAEETGLMGQITCRVLELVRASWPQLAAGRPGFHIAINISSQDVINLDLVEDICRMRELGAGAVIVEITERGMLDRAAAIPALARMRSCGLRVAVDDFGTGYSSLSYLESFRVDMLKIDKSFVDTVSTDAATSHVAVHIIQMAKTLNIDLVAEGVEREEQAAFLLGQGVEMAQGWLFGRPVSLADWSRLPVG